MQTLVSSFLGPLTCYLLMPTLVEVVNSQSVLCISWCQFIGYSRKLSSFYLWPSYSGGNEDNGDLLQKIPCVYCYTQCAQPCSKPAKSLFPQSCISAGSSMVGLTTTSSRRTYAIPAPRAPAPQHSFRRRRSNTVLAVSVGSLGPGVHKACLSPPSISVGNGV